MICQLSSDSVVSNLTKCECLLHQKVKFENLRQKQIYQCHNCQEIGHSALSCLNPYRCVKCDAKHNPGQCKLDKGVDKSKVYCVNCKTHGHSANFKDYPFIKFAVDLREQQKTIKQEEKIKKIQKTLRLTQPNISFAQAILNTQNGNNPENTNNTQIERASQEPNSSLKNINPSVNHNAEKNPPNSRSLPTSSLSEYRKMTDRTQIISQDTNLILKSMQGMFQNFSTGIESKIDTIQQTLINQQQINVTTNGRIKKIESIINNHQNNINMLFNNEDIPPQS